ncbi:glucoamylase family protein [Bacteroides sp. 51]|uniref:glucoamylase family protein n=1 Tax=Bacteroides sp. 51 TaxID=2302938 RepID=UPI001940218B|nr:glucoamylase family protein [Bacteroides sp. 51]
MAFSAFSCSGSDDPEIDTTPFKLEEISINNIKNQDSYTDLDPDLTIVLTFSDKVAANSLSANITLKDKEGKTQPLNINTDNNPVITITSGVQQFAGYELTINTGLKSNEGVSILTGKVYSLSTGMNLSDKFPRITDEELLTLVQKHTFRYFWDFAHPVSGMARERTTSTGTVTTGGTGFGVMALIVAAERGFVSRTEALSHIQKIVSFLDTKCTRYHGAYAHWINGDTGATIPFSADDNGGDLVETALLFQGLLTARNYFKEDTAAETKFRDDITRLWEAIEWSWYRKDSEDVLYWHWSSDKGWIKNLKIIGWNECLIVYILAASSPTYPIPEAVYHEGWAKNGNLANGGSFYGHKLPLGRDYGGPLFFSHYSFLGIDPRNLTDRYANYWEQNRNHSLINYKYCIENPKSYNGYSSDCWGLTASDGNTGYSAHSPSNDKGVIAPTAAISSIPYTPEESMKALHFFYYKMGDKLWADYGFVDAFNLSANWFDNQHIAIDQGPIVIMIENYRTQLLWNLLMSDTEIQAGLTKLGFSFNN